MVRKTYTPTTDEVIDAYTQMLAREASTAEGRNRASVNGLAEFERWLEGEREAVRQEVRERIAQDIAAEAERMILTLDAWTRGEERHFDGLGLAVQIARGATRD